MESMSSYTKDSFCNIMRLPINKLNLNELLPNINLYVIYLPPTYTHLALFLKIFKSLNI